MPEDYLHRVLRSGTAEFAALADVPDPALIRQRGDRRKRRNAVLSGLLAFALGAGGGGFAYASLDRPAHTVTGAAAGSSASGAAAPTESAAPGGRPGLVGITTAGVVEVLDPQTLAATRRLSGDQDAVGDQVSVARDGKTVYFAAKQGCESRIMSVPADGSAKPVSVGKGVLPAVSPDGAKLAFVTEPSSGGPGPRVAYECNPGGETLVIMDLASRATSTYPLGSVPVSHVSWSPDGMSVLISTGPAAGSKGWVLAVLGVTGSAQNGMVPVTGDNAPASYYREGIYLPGGDLLVNRMCCSGSARPSSSLILRVNRAGMTIHQIAVAFLDKDHTSLSVDGSGHWLMYLSGNNLYISHDEATPEQVSSGLIAVAWL